MNHKSQHYLWHRNEPFQCDNGSVLPYLELHYTTIGQMSSKQDNIVWIFHPLTCNSDPSEWWSDLIGPGCVIDPSHYFIICANVLGGCYGSLGASNKQPNSDDRYGVDFPILTVSDMVRAHDHLRQHLGITRIALGLGGSFGGQQLLEYLAQHPTLFDQACAIGANAKHSGWGIAFNETQRMALEADSSFFLKTPHAGAKGLACARAIAVLSYRSKALYDETQTDSRNEISDDFKASQYQIHQGKKIVARFDPHVYWYLTKAMDSHNIGRKCGSIQEALRNVTTKVLLLALKDDLLFSVSDHQVMDQYLPNSTLVCLDSRHGHDSMLKESEKIAHHISLFLSINKIFSVRDIHESSTI